MARATDSVLVSPGGPVSIQRRVRFQSEERNRRRKESCGDGGVLLDSKLEDGVAEVTVT